MRNCLAVFGLALVCLSSVARGETPARLFDLVGARLNLMDEVAAWKWHNRIAIEDSDREAVVLDKAAVAAVRVGLTRESARAFFAAQIDAAKEIQHFWFNRWRTNETAPPHAPDLNRVIRPGLIELGNRIVDAIAATRPFDDSARLRQQFDDAVSIRGLSGPSKTRLYTALISVEAHANRLDRILASGEIRIGTTGDYAPFSSRNESSGSEFTGIDIDLGRDLATSLGVRAEFVATSWPTLMADLAADRFDIGMSGISRTLARQKAAYFSMPYHRGGKTPIARCDDVDRFDTLEEIDRPGVRVIVNPGGTNQRFIEQHLHQAAITVFEDNRRIFDEIAAGRADVMITDAVEVALKAAQYPELCATLPDETFTYQEKAYLMPRDEAWREYVDTWLSLRLGDGTVKDTFAHYLDSSD